MTVFIVHATLGRRRIDYRVVMLGSLLPDLIDKPIGRIFFAGRFQASRLYGHTFLFVVVLVLGIQFLLRGETARRWFILPIAALLHLALDAMWSHPITLFWPLFGTRFPAEPTDSYWLEALTRPVQHPAIAVQELVGLALLVYMIAGYGLHKRQRRKDFLRTGYLVDKDNAKKKAP
ncbi:MAG: metal-dependent hydrolase [Actinomycetota bacterium]